MSALRRFRHAEFVLVRASTDPGGLSLPQLDLHTAENAETTGRDWLAELWSHEAVRTAFGVASPALCEQIIAVAGGAVLERRAWRRLLVSVCSYVVRWQQRSTPFGLFAGVTTTAIGSATHVDFGQQHQMHRRIDPRWLHELITDLETAPGVLAAASFVVNNAGAVRGDRFVVPQHSVDTGTAAAPQAAGGLDEVELALRRTRPVDAALAAARTPVLGRVLIDRLHHAFPAVSRGQITTLISGLVAHRVLVTTLRAPSVGPNPDQHLLTQLGNHVHEGEAGDHVEAVRGDLRAFRSSGALPVTNAVSGVGMPGRPLPPAGIDLALDGQITLPESVLHEAEMAASALLRVSPSPFGTSAWRDYHGRFRDRYGSGAVVPVRELVSDAGLGFPTGFLGAAREQGARLLTDRDAALQAVLQEAVIDGRTEIVLSDALVSELTVGEHGDVTPPERVELAFTLQTASTRALDRGRFKLWVTGAPIPTSSMAGRFADLLDEQEQRRLSDTYPAGDDVMVAQLSFAPRRIVNEAVTRTPRLLPWLLPVGEHPPDLGTDAARSLQLDDLAVTATATQFFLIHRPSGKPVHPYVPHALETTVYTPPLVRFLAELPTARRAMFGPFDFGATRTLRFLPRIRYGRSVLSPARWLLHADDLPPSRAASAEWEQALSRWRERWRMPAHVVLVEGEQRLPLDLDDLPQRTLLRVRLRRAGQAELREAGDPEHRGWAGRACEFLVPLVATGTRPPRPPLTRAVVIAKDGERRFSQRDGVFPGTSSLVQAKLEGHPQRFDTILTEHLPNLHRRLGDEVQYLWFRRHHDTTRPDSDHALQLWLRLSRADRYAAATTCLAVWADELRTAGLVSQLSFETAWTQPGKYGTDLPAAERMFAADCSAALAEITLAEQLQVPRSAVAAVSMVELAADFAASREDGLTMLATVLPQQTGLLDTALREHTLDLARDLERDPSHAPYAGVQTAWAERREALERYGDRLDRPPEAVLRALLHEHVRRGVAVSREHEETTNRLARAVALQALALARRVTQ